MTHRVHALKALTVWRAIVAFALNRLATAKIACLIVAVTAFVASPLDLNIIFVMWYANISGPRS